GAAQPDIERHHRALREADQRRIALVEAALLQFLVDKPVEHGRRGAHAGQYGRGAAVLHAEPLVAVRRHVTRERRVRRDELGIGRIAPTRRRPEFEDAIVEDLTWLGLDWDGPIRRQSEHFDDYRAALSRLEAAGLLYPCFCTRRDIQAEIARAGGAPQGEMGT